MPSFNKSRSRKTTERGTRNQRTRRAALHRYVRPTHAARTSCCTEAATLVTSSRHTHRVAGRPFRRLPNLRHLRDTWTRPLTWERKARMATAAGPASARDGRLPPHHHLSYDDK